MAAHDPECRPPAAADCYPAAERIRYFLGRHLTERDFTDADWYPVSHQRAHHWMLHGAGVIAGLRVEKFPDGAAAECRKNWVIVKAGAALDPCGRLIVLRKDVPVQLPGLPACGTSPSEGDAGGGCCSDQPPDPKAPPPAKPFLLCLRYRECGGEPVPVVVSHPTGRTKEEFGRTREGYAWCKLDYDPAKVSADCWGAATAPACDPYPPGEPDCDGPAGVFAPPRPCGADVVPLALITPAPAKDPKDSTFAIDMKGRHYVPGPLHPTTLTRICETNWTHNSPVTVEELETWGRLTVTLTNPLDDSMAPDKGRELVDGRQVFQVHYTREEDGWQPHWLTPKSVTVEGKTVVFELDPEGCTETAKLIDRVRKCKESPPVVYVTLRCDFLLDNCGRAVDGNHIRRRGWKDAPCGSLPTGDGVPGGTFESWFTVTPDDSDPAKENSGGQ